MIHVIIRGRRSGNIRLKTQIRDAIGQSYPAVAIVTVGAKISVMPEWREGFAAAARVTDVLLVFFDGVVILRTYSVPREGGAPLVCVQGGLLGSLGGDVDCQFCFMLRHKSMETLTAPIWLLELMGFPEVFQPSGRGYPINPRNMYTQVKFKKNPSSCRQCFELINQ